jgi:hypothetical protein
MDRTFAVAAAVTAASVLGYVAAAYPSRAFTITGVMLGVTLLAVADGGADA